MKKLKLYSQNLKDVQVLSREELKKIVGGAGSGGNAGGGGCCCEHHTGSDGFDWYSCGMTKAQAIAAAAASGGKWCCDSCPASMDPCNS